MKHGSVTPQLIINRAKGKPLYKEKPDIKERVASSPMKNVERLWMSAYLQRGIKVGGGLGLLNLRMRRQLIRQ